MRGVVFLVFVTLARANNPERARKTPFDDGGDISHFASGVRMGMLAAANASWSAPPLLRAGGEKFSFIDNGVVKLGLDLSRGGSIGFFGPSGSSTNLVNTHDMGREIQLSFYAGPAFYNPGDKCDKLYTGKEWPWNPIGAGDCKGHASTVNSLKTTATTAHVVATPLQWACDNVPCECEFEQSITLGGPGNTGARIDATLHNHRSDTTVYPPLNQELPALYTAGVYYRLVTSAAGKIVELNSGWPPQQFTADENWAALVDKNGFGMGIVGLDTQTFAGGFTDPSKKGTGGPFDTQTGYIAPFKAMSLPPQGTYGYTFWLVLGNIDTIRAYAQQVRPQRR